MPLTPAHVLPAGTVYFLTYRHLHGTAFFLATLLIDVEPALYLIFNVSIPRIPLLAGGYAPLSLHMATHNPFGILILVAPAITVLAKLLEFGKPFWLAVLGGAEWVTYSWKRTYLSAMAGGFLHLGWDVTMHTDINLGFPFASFSNPFVSYDALTIILLLSLALMLPSYILGKKINRGNPFKKLP